MLRWMPDSRGLMPYPSGLGYVHTHSINLLYVVPVTVLLISTVGSY
jgi:hypothetical protein